MSKDTVYIEFGFWKPVIVAILICAALVFAGYKAGQSDGLNKGFIAGVEYVQQDVIRQCDSRFPLRIGPHGFRCIRLSR
jgi:hypothetical protein